MRRRCEPNFTVFCGLSIVHHWRIAENPGDGRHEPARADGTRAPARSTYVTSAAMLTEFWPKPTIRRALNR